MANDLRNSEKHPAATEKRKPPRAALDWSADGVLGIKISGSWGRIVRASVHETVSSGLLSQAATLGSQGNRVDADGYDASSGDDDGAAAQSR
ncbi:hypothetical protein [Roseovarius sp. M141]|uniref:hypothetical protein n=1 Tax=Roseovarius sp. M141 TaxID=2583806 RepID=UPI0020CE5A7A|nr:hypothetical protein [Roseovarius sp. M141]MCQ0091353.1 hypothetical protein [Roseovarius sp. M141]